MAIRLFAFVMLAALMLPFAWALEARTPANKRAPHPVMTAFLEEVENGELEKAAKRIASVNDMFGRQAQYTNFSQDELVALLAECKLDAHISLKTAVSIEKTQWDCPKGEKYSMIFNHVGEDANPYLYVGRIETTVSRKVREAEFTKRFVSGEFPSPIRLRMASTPEERAVLRERKRAEAAQEPQKREALGEAVLSGEFDAIAQLTTPRTASAYITHDPYFDVKIKHINGLGLEELQLVLRRATEELGKPLSVECRLGEGRWAPHICEWQLENPENSLRAEMNFKGEGGTLNSIRVFRSTPEERAELRQQAIDLGVIES